MNALGLRAPRAEDGPAVSRLIARCAPLDTNSLYCNLLQCSEFSDTCAIALANVAVAGADEGEQVVGFVSGFIPPRRPDTLFVWQVAVDPTMRGQRLGPRLIHHILSRHQQAGPGLHGPLTHVQATVTPTNTASQRMFASLASDLSTRIHSEPGFDRDLHFGGEHESEHLFTIGPFNMRNSHDK